MLGWLQMIEVILLVLFLGLAGFALAGFIGAPWVPTRTGDIEKIFEDCNVKAGELFIELGCGDGRVVAAAAQRGLNAIGYEVNPAMWLIAVLRTIRYPSAKIKLASFWRAPLSSADVVFVFLIPRFMARLEAKLKRELKPGARAVSYVFKLPNKKPKLSRRRWQIYNF